ncbi:hypothetical protein DFJ58DRAFT_886201 [Suillus subalutaceus]|uniref:uncharacterized protein n=1 Tax=Suillus subalutaceus TaxID=48586 RepID=UPI001B87CA14|nr:uncharacterized protein DFJ58DRAFT_886201 [Suillus subalutaceus]KAG1851582.1 hypothetical protein DFJ58DRAFT_886201 [Suillus subalutaceus]
MSKTISCQTERGSDVLVRRNGLSGTIVFPILLSIRPGPCAQWGKVVTDLAHTQPDSRFEPRNGAGLREDESDDPYAALGPQPHYINQLMNVSMTELFGNPVQNATHAGIVGSKSKRWYSQGPYDVTVAQRNIFLPDIHSLGPKSNLAVPYPATELQSNLSPYIRARIREVDRRQPASWFLIEEALKPEASCTLPEVMQIVKARTLSEVLVESTCLKSMPISPHSLPRGNTMLDHNELLRYQLGANAATDEHKCKGCHDDWRLLYYYRTVRGKMEAPARRIKDEFFPGLKQRYAKCNLEHDFATPYTFAEGRGAEAGRVWGDGHACHGGGTMD